MREIEAAAYLGVNTRTLLRYRQSGKLAYRETAGKTRPLIEYEQSDIEALKAELEERRQRSVKARESGQASAKPAPRVSFGLSPEDYELFAQEAGRYGMSVAEYGRRLVRDGLEGRLKTEAAELREEVKHLRGEMERLRADFAGGLEAILEYTGLSPEEARQWVTDNLR